MFVALSCISIFILAAFQYQTKFKFVCYAIKKKFSIFAHQTINREIFMIHTVKINDDTPIGKRILTDLRMQPLVVKFESSTISSTPPEGYMTGDEFFLGIKTELKKRCKENGLL